MANEVPSEPKPSQQQAPERKPSERERYDVFVREYRGEYVTSQACRLLLKYIKEYIAKLPLLMRHKTVEDVTCKVLDRFPHQRIDLDVLEKYELVACNPEYGVGATGDEFGYRALLDEKIIDGDNSSCRVGPIVGSCRQHQEERTQELLMRGFESNV